MEGIFNNEIDALKCAKQSIKDERDDYHRFEITKYELDKCKQYQENITIYTLNRTDKEITIKKIS